MRILSRLNRVCWITLFALSTAAATLAQVPQLLNYQGRIAVNGTNFTGSGQFKFALVNGGTNISRTATGTPTISGGFLTIVTVMDGGVGYGSAPTVVATGGGGSGAVLTAQISGGSVTNVIVNNPGSGYTSLPGIVFAAPGSNTTYTTYWSNDGSSSSGGQPTASVSLPVTKGLYSVLLGDPSLPNMNPLPAAAFTNSDVRLRVWFSDGLTGFQQLTPDQRLAAVGYAIMAGTVPDGSITAAKIAPGSIGPAQLMAGSGSILLQQITGETNVPAAVNTSYLLTNNTEATTFTLPAGANVGDKVRIAGNAAGWTATAAAGQNLNGPVNPVTVASVVITNSNGSAVSMACSGDGGQFFAAQQYGSIYYSSNDNANLKISTVSPPSRISITADWSSVATSSDGSRLVAVRYGGSIYTSSNYGVTWTQQASAPSGNWYSVGSSSDGSRLVAVQQNGGSIYTSSNYGVTWTQQAGAPSGNWYSVASSSDGSRLVAGQNSSGRLYTSSNYGVTWTQQTDAPAGEWASVTSSSDGSKLVGVQNVGGNPTSIYTSSNYGVTWTRQTNGPSGFWYSVASSSNGSRLVAAESSGIYTSSDYGVSWTQQTNAPSGDWRAVATSSDGSRLVAGQNSSGRLYTSSNYGVTWTQQTDAPSGNWRSVASSSDGSRLAAAKYGSIYTSSNYGVTWMSGNFPINDFSGLAFDWKALAASVNGKQIIAVASSILLNANGAGFAQGVLYSSTNYGVTFSQLTNAPSGDWQAVATSSDGSRLVAVQPYGGIYTSSNYGVTWTQQTNAPAENWYSVGSSSDGSRLVAGPEGYIYTSSNYGVTWTQQTNAPNDSWPSVASSSDGLKLVATRGFRHGVYTSANQGATWNTTLPEYTDFSYRPVGCSGDGAKLIEVVSASQSVLVFASPNFGATWSQPIAFQHENFSASPMAYSTAGTKLVVANSQTIYSLRLYQYQAISGGPFTSCELIYSGNGQWQISSSSTPISGL